MDLSASQLSDRQASPQPRLDARLYRPQPRTVLCQERLNIILENVGISAIVFELQKVPLRQGSE